MRSVEYKNFELSLYGYEPVPAAGDRYRVRVLASPQGSNQPEDKADAVEVPEGLGNLVRALNERNAAQPEEFERLCRRLGELLLPKGARDLLRRNLDWLTRKEGQALRFRIWCESDALSQVPWEFAYVPFALAADKGDFPKSGFLIANPSLCIVRHEEGAAVNIPPLGDRPVEVLFTSAQPERTRAISSNQDLQSLSTALKHVARQSVVCPVERVSAKVLQETLMGRNVDIFHFSGHADVLNDRGYLAFEDVNRELAPFFGEDLAVLLFNKGVRLATLFACETAAIEGPSPWSGVARSLVSVGIPAVVGMQYRVRDLSAVKFVETFYKALAQRLGIEDAVTEGRRALLVDDALIRDIGVPVLYLHSGDDFDTALLRPTPESKVQPAAGLRARFAAGLCVAVDYKDIHDKLHAARYGPFSEFARAAESGAPTAQSLENLEAHAEELIGLRESIREIQGRGNCDPKHVDPLVEKLGRANEQVDKWIKEPSPARLEGVVERFGHVLDYFLATINTVLQERVRTFPAIESIESDESIPAPERAELTLIVTELVTWAQRQDACQELELLLLRLRTAKTLDAQRLSNSWDDVSDALARIVDGWDDRGTRKLKDTSKSLWEKVAEVEGGAALEGIHLAFVNFSRAVGIGYFTVDTRLRGACSSSLPRLRQAGTNR